MPRPGFVKGKLVLLSCAGFVCGVALAEIGLRLAAPDNLSLQVQWGIPDDDPERRARQTTRTVWGTFTYDENGFRIGSGLPYDRTILFIGDSFTEGFGVGDDETFARATERALRRDGLLVRSLNAGNRGFGAAQELKVLRRVLARSPVDAIVMQSFPMNDLSDNLAYGGFGIVSGQLVEYETPSPPLRTRVTGAIARSWLRYFFVVRAVANAMSAGTAPYDSPSSFDLERAILSEIVSVARGRGIPLVVLVIPTRLVQDVRRGGMPRSPAQVAEIQRFERVRALVQGFGVPWIDAGESFPTRRRMRPRSTARTSRKRATRASARRSRSSWSRSSEPLYVE